MYIFSYTLRHPPWCFSCNSQKWVMPLWGVLVCSSSRWAAAKSPLPAVREDMHPPSPCPDGTNDFFSQVTDTWSPWQHVTPPHHLPFFFPFPLQSFFFLFSVWAVISRLGCVMQGTTLLPSDFYFVSQTKRAKIKWMGQTSKLWNNDRNLQSSSCSNVDCKFGT